VPHLGANIPLADQHLLSFFSNVQAARDNLDQRLNSVAAKQFLVAHYSYLPGIGGAPGFRDRFMLALRDNGERNSAGYPVHLRRIALANGKLNGLLPINNAEGEPGGTILDVNVYTRFWSGLGAAIIGFFGFSYKTTSFTTIATSNIRFLPNPNNSATIFYGLTHQTSGLNWGIVGAPTKIGVVRAAGGPQGCWDLAPGGLRDTHRQLRDQFEGAGQGEPYKISVTDVHPNHCFIPTISALGFQYQTLSSYQSTSSLPNPFANLLGRDLVCTGEIPFDAYYGPTSSNTFHVMPDNTGLLFLGRELSRTVATPTFAIFQPALCLNASATAYSVNLECFASRPGQAPPVNTYTWIVGFGLQLVSGQGTATVQLQPLPGFTGAVTVQVVAMRTGYATSAPLTRTILVGPPEGDVIQTDPPGICLNKIANFTITNFDPNVYYTIDSPSGTAAIPRHPASSAFRLKGVGSVPQTGTFTITGSNACGSTTSQGYLYDFGPCGGYRYALSPNPADSQVEIQQLPDSTSSARVSKVPASESKGSLSSSSSNIASPLLIDTVQLYNMYGQLKLQQSIQNTAIIQLPTNQIPAGLYVVHLLSGGVLVSSQHLQVTR